MSMICFRGYNFKVTSMLFCGHNVPDLRQWNSIVAKLDSSKVMASAAQIHLRFEHSVPVNQFKRLLSRAM